MVQNNPFRALPLMAQKYIFSPSGPNSYVSDQFFFFFNEEFELRPFPFHLALVSYQV